MNKWISLGISAAVLSLSACMVDDSSGPPLSYDASALLNNTATDFFAIEAAALKTHTDALQTSLKSYCSDTNIANGTQKQLAQTAWLTAATQWRKLEAFNFGPAEYVVNSGITADTLLAQTINNYGKSSASKINASAIDANMERFELNKSADINASNVPIAVLGFDALDYLLFTPTPETLASGSNPTWDALSPQDKLLARCNYALSISQRLSSDVSLYKQLWDDYQTSFTTDIEDSLKNLSDSVFFLDTLVKDVKLAQVLGINDKCNSGRCEENVESLYARASYALILANLESFKQVFTGGEGYGFEEAYIERGEAALARSMIDSVDLAISTASALNNGNQSLYDYAASVDKDDCENFAAAPSSGSTGCHLYGQIKIISDKLKTEFTTVIDTSIPSNAAGDGD